jgi:transposase-like protein
VSIHSALSPEQDAQVRHLVTLSPDKVDVLADYRCRMNIEMHRWRREKFGCGSRPDKTTVFGSIERGGDVRTASVPNTTGETLAPEVRQHVEAGSTVYTDEQVGYRDLSPDYAHESVSHGQGEYVRPHSEPGRLLEPVQTLGQRDLGQRVTQALAPIPDRTRAALE